MTERKTVYLFLIPLLVASITLVSTSPAHANPAAATTTLSMSLANTTLSISPANTTVPAVGAYYNVSVMIQNVTNLKGCSIQLSYNATLLHAIALYSTAITATTTDWMPVNASMLFPSADGIKPPAYGDPVINNTRTNATNYAYVWISAWGFTTFTGSGAVFTIKFMGTALGNNSTLHLYETEVLDIYSDPITHDTKDGKVWVIPEFPTFIIMPLLLIMSLAAALLGKAFWSRKRKDAIVAG